MLPILHPVIVSDEKYSFTLAAGFWLNDESLGLAVIELFSKSLKVGRQHPSLRKELVLLRKYFLHCL